MCTTFQRLCTLPFWDSDAQTKHKRFRWNKIKYMLTIPKRDISPALPTWRSNISKGKRAQTLNCCAHFCTNEALTFPILKNSKTCGGGPGKWPCFFQCSHCMAFVLCSKLPPQINFPRSLDNLEYTYDCIRSHSISSRDRLSGELIGKMCVK